MPHRLDPARHADDADAPVLLHAQAVPDPQGRGVVARAGAVAREAVHALEERREGLVEAAQHLLQGGEGPAGEPVRIGRAARFQFGSLLGVAPADPAAAVGFDALLQASVVQTAEVAQPRVEEGGLRSVRSKPILAGADLPGLGAPGSFQGSSGHRQTSAFPRRLKATLP
ncbi:hypothetical protein [Methylobacterium isbiliense]|uniref:hypothetical protein n=1 Tax=Methylobacterium isbiliense TaxID=315478 RepID=UPI001EE1AC0F|nr:hypothetical protein [Methylobacterium isbiliense]MDN3627041.1 hypothetical protein [Methylobacterium isbiliense]